MRDNTPCNSGALEYSLDIAEIEREMQNPTLSLEELQALDQRLTNTWRHWVPVRDTAVKATALNLNRRMR